MLCGFWEPHAGGWFLKLQRRFILLFSVISSSQLYRTFVLRCLLASDLICQKWDWALFSRTISASMYVSVLPPMCKLFL
jgi:hypothetical protein